MKLTKHFNMTTKYEPYMPNAALLIIGKPRWYCTPGSPQMKAISPAMNDPTKTIPIAWPAVRPFARLLDPNDHAEAFTEAAILCFQSASYRIFSTLRWYSPETKISLSSVTPLLGWRGNDVPVCPPIECLLVLTFLLHFPMSERLWHMGTMSSPGKRNHI